MIKYSEKSELSHFFGLGCLDKKGFSIPQILPAFSMIDVEE